MPTGARDQEGRRGAELEEGARRGAETGRERRTVAPTRTTADFHRRALPFGGGRAIYPPLNILR
jgi:hypothetical protein